MAAFTYITTWVTAYLVIGLICAIKESYYNNVSDHNLARMFPKATILWPRDTWEDINAFIKRVFG